MERVASALWSEAAAITGERPAGRASGIDVSWSSCARTTRTAIRAPIEVVQHERQTGEYCIGLPQGTDENVCRYVLQVGNRDDGTLTRAFVFSTDDDPIDIDFRSEAVVRLVLAEIPPAALCEFSPERAAEHLRRGRRRTGHGDG